MGEVVLSDIRLARRAPSDGGAASLNARDAALNLSKPFTADDMHMDHVDNGMPSDSPYCAPPDDCA